MNNLKCALTRESKSGYMSLYLRVFSSPYYYGLSEAVYFNSTNAAFYLFSDFIFSEKLQSQSFPIYIQEEVIKEFHSFQANYTCSHYITTFVL